MVFTLAAWPKKWSSSYIPYFKSERENRSLPCLKKRERGIAGKLISLPRQQAVTHCPYLENLTGNNVFALGFAYFLSFGLWFFFGFFFPANLMFFEVPPRSTKSKHFAGGSLNLTELNLWMVYRLSYSTWFPVPASALS